MAPPPELVFALQLDRVVDPALVVPPLPPPPPFGLVVPVVSVVVVSWVLVSRLPFGA